MLLTCRLADLQAGSLGGNQLPNRTLRTIGGKTATDSPSELSEGRQLPIAPPTYQRKKVGPSILVEGPFSLFQSVDSAQRTELLLALSGFLFLLYDFLLFLFLSRFFLLFGCLFLLLSYLFLLLGYLPFGCLLFGRFFLLLLFGHRTSSVNRPWRIHYSLGTRVRQP